MFIGKSSLGYPGVACWSHFGRSLVPLESLLVVFEGVEISSIIRRNFEDSLGDARLRQDTQLRVKVFVQGGTQQPVCKHTSCQIQATRL